MFDVRTRGGVYVKFNSDKITEVLLKIKQDVNELTDGDIDGIIAMTYSKLCTMGKKHISTETINDTLQDVLYNNGFKKTAEALVILRDVKRRMYLEKKDLSKKLVENYIGLNDWKVKENSNMGYSLQGLNNYLFNYISEEYWLNTIYPKNIRNAHNNGLIKIHDLGNVSSYCTGWTLEQLFLEGFNGVSGKLECKPPKHFGTALGQIVNFLYTIAGECYSDDTEVLTETGWKLFSKVDIDNDKVATVNLGNRQLQYLKPSRYIEKDYSGELINFKNNTIDILVTPNHNMVIAQYAPHKKREDYDLKIIKAKDYNFNTNLIPNKSEWVGEETEWFELPGMSIVGKALGKDGEDGKLEIPAKKIPMDLWLQFLGIYISEGSAYARKGLDKRRGTARKEYITAIPQKKFKKEMRNICEKIAECLGKKCSVTIRKDGLETYKISSKQLYNYTRKLGLSYDKYLPAFINTLSKRQLKILHDHLMMGDGDMTDCTYHCNYYTASKRLADDVLTLFIKLGYMGDILTKSKTINGKKYTWYQVSKHSSIYHTLENSYNIKYDGKVYCVETSNGTLVVRRNNKACICGNCAGAVAFSNLDTYVAPFIRYDNLDYTEVRQAVQEFVYNMNVPTRVGFQQPFSNVTIDLAIPKSFVNKYVVFDGKYTGDTYGMFQKEADMFNRAFFEVMTEGDASGRVFSFPVITVNVTKEFDWDNENLIPFWQSCAKYGLPTFANYVNSDMNPDDVTSMCCRLRLDKRQLEFKGGGLFGAGGLTGSIGVVTMNLPRIAYLSKGNVESFYKILSDNMDLAKESLEIKRSIVEKYTEKGLYPYCERYLKKVKEGKKQYWANHFSTIGMIGANEMCLNMFGEDLTTRKSQAFTMDMLDFMRDKLADYQVETGNMYNLEQTPGEGTSYSLAIKDKKTLKGIITSGTEDVPYYTNSTQLPVWYSDDVFDILDIQDNICSKFTGGSACHLWIGEELTDINTVKSLVKVICSKYKIPYFSLTPTFSICPKHGYLPGNHIYCPLCDKEIALKKGGVK